MNEVDVEIGRRVLPHSMEAETSVMGSIMLDESVMDAVAAIVSEGDFYHPGLGLIFECAKAVRARCEPIDLVTVANELRSRDRLNAVGGYQFLGELTDVIPTVAHVEQHARIVADLAQARRMIQKLVELSQLGYASGSDTSAYLDKVQTDVLEFAMRKGRRDPVMLQDVMMKTLEDIEKAAERGQRITGIETGLDAFDRQTCGLNDGELIIVAGRPGMGKSALVIGWLEAAAAQAANGLIFTLEMQNTELAKRLISTRARVPGQKFRSGTQTSGDMVMLNEAIQGLWNHQLFLDDSTYLTVNEIRQKARVAKNKAQRAGRRFVMAIDYLQLMDHGKADRVDQAIGNTTRSLKNLAKELQSPIIALSQLNRSAETRPGKDHRPQLADLRESGNIEQDADEVVMIYREEVYNKDTENKGIAELIVTKQRNGPTGIVRVGWVGEFTQFTNLAPEFNQQPEDAQ